LALKNGSKLGKYLVGEQIGAGGMGIVYLALDTVLHRRVALKTILPDKAADRDFLSRFRREALSVSRIDHPHIVRLFDFVEGDPAKSEPTYMVMEFLPGQNLGQIIRKGPLEVTRAVDIIIEACAAVGTCHRHGFVHRDIKPTNIFVATYDRIETTKMLDFGAAKMWGEGRETEASELFELTRKGTAIGTPEYLAPEILQGGTAGPEADQYALGVVLYTALAGRKPFISDAKAEFKDFQLWQRIAKGEYPKLHVHRKELPAGIEEIVERAMHLDPARRFTDVHAFGASLLYHASAPARVRWSAHFTSVPEPMKRHNSVSNEVANVDATIPPPSSALSIASAPPTVASRPDQRSTRPFNDVELRFANRDGRSGTGELETATTVQRTLEPDSLDEEASYRQGLLSPIVLDEAAGEPAGASAAPQMELNARSATKHQSGRNRNRHPALFLAGCSFALVLALGVAIVLHRPKSAPLPRPAPPADLFPSATRTPATTPPIVRPAPPLPLSPTPAAQEVAPPVGGPVSVPADDVRPIATKRHPPIHGHRRLPAVDQKGFGIPSD